jgi:hypothetical protein
VFRGLSGASFGLVQEMAVRGIREVVDFRVFSFIRSECVNLGFGFIFRGEFTSKRRAIQLFPLLIFFWHPRMSFASRYDLSIS